jgi:hypothetical protein
MVSDARWAQSREVGKQGEESFVLACEALGYRCRKSSRQEDIELHIDYWVTRPQGETSVDVKGQKQNEQVWVELKNVRGHAGWLYGHAGYIAFEMASLGGFVMVSRSQLAELIEMTVEEVFVRKDDAYLKLYQRDDRLDVITRIELSDLELLPTFKIINYAPSSSQAR